MDSVSMLVIAGIVWLVGKSMVASKRNGTFMSMGDEDGEEGRPMNVPPQGKRRVPVRDYGNKHYRA